MLSLCDLLENATDLVVKHDLTNDNRLKKKKGQIYKWHKKLQTSTFKENDTRHPIFFFPIGDAP